MNEWLFKPPPPLAAVHENLFANIKPVLPAVFRAPDVGRQRLETTNMVYRIETHSHTPFLTMFANIHEVRRRRVRFPGVRVVYGSSQSDVAETFMIYVKGRFITCGLRTEMSGIRALQMFRLDVQQCGIPIGLGSFVPVNVVVRASIGFPVDIRSAYESRRLPEASLEEKDFPGLIFKVQRVQVLAFPNGRCVLTGAGDCMEAESVYNEATKLLRPFDSTNNPNVPKTSKRSQNDKATGRRARSTATAAVNSAKQNAGATTAKRPARRRWPPLHG